MGLQIREKDMQIQYSTIFQIIKKTSLYLFFSIAITALIACAEAKSQPKSYILRRVVTNVSEEGRRHGTGAAIPIIEAIAQQKAEIEFNMINVEMPLEPLDDRLLITPISENIPHSIIDVFEKDAIFKDAYFDIDIRLSEYNLCTNCQDIRGWEKYEHANVYWSKYTVIDLDRDGTNELVYLVDLETGGGQYVIFHDIDGTAYSFRIPFRSMVILRTDGTAESTDGAADGKWYKITGFEKNGFSTEIMGMMSSSSAKSGEDVHEKSYYVGTKEVTEEYFFDTFIPEMEAMESVKWIEP